MVRDASKWHELAESESKKLSTSLFTTNEMRKILRSLVDRSDCPIEQVSIFISQYATFPRIDLLSLHNNDTGHAQPETRRPPLNEDNTIQCNITFSQRGKFGREDALLAANQLEKLVKGFWAEGMRDKVSRIRSKKNPEDENRIQRTLERWAGESRSIHYFFADLDKFKNINDQHNMETGDRVIQEVAAILERSVGDSAVPIHRSGDEFLVFVPNASDADCLRLARAVSKSIDEHDFEVGDTPVGISIGIAEIPPSLIPNGFASLEKLPEKTVKTGAGKERGTARLLVSEEVLCPSLVAGTVSQSICLAKADLAGVLPFNSPWLNLIVEQVVQIIEAGKIEAGSLQPELEDLLKWIRPTFDSKLAVSAFSPYCVVPKFSEFDALMAVACGVFRSIAKIDIACFADPLKIAIENGQLKLTSGCNLIASIPCTDFSVSEVELGYRIEHTHSESGNTFRQAILVHIGHSVDSALKPLFTDVISVDDRPTKGGELRDFWEATIAKLIAVLNRCSTKQTIFVMGDCKFAAETVSWLNRSAEWGSEAEALSIKTGMPAVSIREAGAKITGCLTFCSNRDELTDEYSIRLKAKCTLTSINDDTVSTSIARPVLRRTLDATPFLLKATDGCRVTTIAESFPVVVEILRTSEIKTVRDQAGMQLREVTDFKVIVERPAEHSLPLFYDKEIDSFEDYANRAFLNSSSLFRQRITTQWNLVRKQLIESLKNYPNISTTRRAILVVPFETDSSKDPLGLVCIRITPRLAEHGVAFDFSFVWRTVEALVGFPYSIYGSARFANYLVEDIRAVLNQDGSNSFRSQIGSLTYIAMSLHMFVDEYGQRIAKRIVDDASA